MMKRTTRQIHRVVQATRSICSLPAVPSQGWATDVANAIADISPSSIVGVLITTIDEQSLSLKPVSTGVSCSTWEHSPTPDTLNQALYLQDKLERINTLGLSIPEHSLDRGLVASLTLLHPHWSTTPIGRIFASQKLQSPVLAIIPITDSSPGLFLVITVAHDPNQTDHADHPDSSSTSSPSTELTTGILGCLVPLLSQRARMALSQVTHPKAWLTDRELEILDQLILGHSVRVIAENLGRSAHTIHDHVKNLHKKLNASSRGELIAKALGYETCTGENAPLEHDPVVLLATSQLAELKPQRQNAPHAKSLHPKA
jgi:DNA-binding CsgD family transcriptional regulator